MAALMQSARGRAKASGVVAITTMLSAAGAYCQAAQRDEARGFPCTAAMEWRRAADLLAGVPALADQCWEEWERLMQLPRRLAAPVESQTPMRSELVLFA